MRFLYIFKIYINIFLFSLLFGNISKPYPETIKIGILQNKKQITLSSDGEVRVYDKNNSVVGAVHKEEIWKIKIKNGKIEVFSTENRFITKFSLPVKFVPERKNLISVGGKFYRGDIYLIPAILDSSRVSENMGVTFDTGHTFTVVNQLNIEDYLKGVLRKEIGSEAPLEAMKSQAVVARTATLSKLGKHSKYGFDLCSDVCCQVYGGVSAENEKTNLAVESTRGEVIVSFEDKLFPAVYHACCGGITEDATSVWTGKEKKFSSVLCGEPVWHSAKNLSLENEKNFSSWVKNKPESYCDWYPRYRWVKKFSQEELEKMVVKKGYDIGKLKEIKLGPRGKAGTLRYIVLVGTKTEVTIEKEYNIRELFGGVFKFYSGKFIIELEHNSSGEKIYKFTGCGWGHGVGMCQAGAIGMAKNYNKNYKEIISHYFPNTKIKKIY